MEVLIQFEPAFAGTPTDAVWISDTRANRTWFERQAGRIDANSALFDPGSDPLTIIWHIFDHHPDWSAIVVRGTALTPEIERSVKPDASAVEAGPDGFRLVRP
jgi:hypothetical protein